jgi:anti-sigma-K factor RskA
MIAEELQDQAALYVLGALDSSEAAEFEKALFANAELRELVRQLRDSVSALAYAAPAKTPPPELRTRILDQIAPREKVVALPPERKSSGASWLPWAIAAALAIYCGVLTVNRSRSRGNITATQQSLVATQENFTKTRQDLAMTQQNLSTIKQDLTNTQQNLAETQANLVKTQKELATTKQDLMAVRSADPLEEATIVSLASTPDARASASGSIVWRQDRQSGLIKVSGLPVLDPTKDYQLWVVDADHKEPISAGVVRINAQGVVEVRFKPVDNANHPKAFAISIEGKGGSQKKQGPIVMLGAVSA